MIKYKINNKMKKLKIKEKMEKHKINIRMINLNKKKNKLLKNKE